MAVTVKLSDGGANLLSFYVDSFKGPEFVDYDKYNRSTSIKLHHYAVGNKRRWELGIDACPNADKVTLYTIYSLRDELEFYEDSAAAKTADVFWRGNFSFIPTKKHRHFRNIIWEARIILEEI